MSIGIEQESALRTPDSLVVLDGISDREVEDALKFARASLAGLPAGATADDVRRVALSRGLEVSHLVDNVMYASSPARRSHTVVQTKWLLQFRFADGAHLTNVRLRKGIIAP